MVEILPEVNAIIERQEAALQRIAMRIMEFPKEGRQEAKLGVITPRPQARASHAAGSSLMR